MAIVDGVWFDEWKSIVNGHGLCVGMFLKVESWKGAWLIQGVDSMSPK